MDHCVSAGCLFGWMVQVGWMVQCQNKGVEDGEIGSFLDLWMLSQLSRLLYVPRDDTR